MFDLVTNNNGEDVHQDLTDNEECSAEQNITKRPAIVQGVDDKDNLRDDIDNEA